MNMKETLRTLARYRWQLFVFLVMLALKDLVDAINDPVRHALRLNFTPWIHALEGDAVRHIQQAFKNDILTVVLGYNYIIGYIAIAFFGLVIFAWKNNRRLASLTAMNFFMIYLITIPFYLFFPVDVTSDYLPSMEPLMYRLSPWFHAFFVGSDPFDNCIPSLHIGLPLGLFLCLAAELNRQGGWKIRAYKSFMIFTAVQIAVFAFSILYLGIHWITDVFVGAAFGVAGAWAVDYYTDGVFIRLDALERNVIRRMLRKLPGFRKIRLDTGNENAGDMRRDGPLFFKALFQGAAGGHKKDGEGRQG